MLHHTHGFQLEQIVHQYHLFFTSAYLDAARLYLSSFMFSDESDTRRQNGSVSDYYSAQSADNNFIRSSNC